MKNLVKPFWMVVLFALALPLAIALPVWALKLGTRPDPQVQVLLKAPSVIETFRKAADSAAKPAQSEACPLIANAKVFAAIIDPPRPVGQSDSPTVRPSDSPRAPVVSRPLFEVKATSEYLTRPQESRALVSEPGSGLRWVRPGDSMGHVKVDSIKAGVVVWSDGSRLGEVAMVQDEGKKVRREEGKNEEASSPVFSSLARADVPAFLPPPPERRPDSGTARPSDSKTVARLDNKPVGRSDSGTVRPSDRKTVEQSDSHTVVQAPAPIRTSGPVGGGPRPTRVPLGPGR